MRTLLFAALLTISAAGAALAQAPSTLEERMTGAEFKAAGLDKLSPDELAQLNAWLQRSGQAAAGYAASSPRSDRRGFEKEGDHTDIVSRIVGEFRGWDGKTQFVLENGQVWVQIDSAMLAGVRLNNPTVTIRSGMFDSWRLKVEGYNAFTAVRRIK